MKQLIIFGYCLLLMSRCYGQLSLSYGEPFDSLFNQAELYSEEKEYVLAAELFDTAFLANSNKFPVILFHQYAFKACYLADRVDRSMFYLGQLAELGFVSNEVYILFIEDERFSKLRAHKDWPDILKAINSKREKYNKIVQQLDEVNTSDQTLRQLLKCSEESFQNKKQKDYLWELIGKEDSLNLITIDAIVSEYGWLGIYKVGEEASSAMWKVIQHSPLDIQEKYLPIIRSSVKKGETSASSLAFLEDRVRLYKGQYQIYGTQVVKDDNGVPRVFPIENPSEVDQRRAVLGFEPLAEYLDFFDVVIESEKDLQLDYLLAKWAR